MPMIRIRSSSIQENVHLGGVPTSQTTSDASIATTQYVDTAISDLVNSAPEILNTLAELSQSISNDGNQS